MKTLTIKQDIIDALDSDESKLEFANSVIELFSDPKKSPSGKVAEALTEGFNSNLPEPMEGAPDFDSSNMAAAGYERYSMVRAGYVPAGGKGLNCGYSEYEYKHLNDLAEHEFSSLWRSAEYKLTQSKSERKRDYAKFLKYLCDICSWFSFEKLKASMRSEGIDV